MPPHEEIPVLLEGRRVVRLVVLSARQQPPVLTLLVHPGDRPGVRAHVAEVVVQAAERAPDLI
jgi:hypothetical protein